MFFLDDSDEPEGLIHHLPRRLLGAGGQQRTKTRVGTRQVDDTDNEDEDESEHVLGQWSRRDSGQVGASIPPYIKPILEDAEEENFEYLKTASAMELYKQFQPDSFAEEIIYQSKLYAVQKNLKQALDIMSVDKYRYTILTLFIYLNTLYLGFKETYF